MPEPDRCELCGKPITPANPGVEYYIGKRQNSQKIMYRHENPCPGVDEEQEQEEE